ncbi:hypothetical protein NB574_17850 [Vibrio vulnificus]|uniref:hypothetical protein n=1 Tax=Vibrio vulnificus TaxID=672 RepID=UPI000A267368|nr:hypothetical protein [Vibrio vulnificus]EHZ7344393.1 hypothetical protein [Vibrio vulnificus]EID4422521.1 hypothetical protein [Vibrio vulnificus]ELE1959811.1 hypothetical protein [Vibrio vulnificus]ELV8699473.1 hypothetical protein [Vibrio vulnificus]ELV8809868.1 hypothetical protein [Vibrio vulnificus]
MKKRILPIPLILLIPIVMLAVVMTAGIYRFTLSDEEILAKFPSQQIAADAIVERLTGIKTANPLTVLVPESKAFALMTDFDAENAIVVGQYDSGAERGSVTVFAQYWRELKADKVSWFVAPLAISNQGSGHFYYLGLFKYDPVPRRVVMTDAQFLGDRIRLDKLTKTENSSILLSYKEHSSNQSFSEQPLEIVVQEFSRQDDKLKLNK